ncbi:MAG TPA: hypothetical protein VLS90_11885, partial [Thermodesulfobacteriota bacterium]|nr:hypothetical protein [Thermodesulfobacteriota bacterium]
LLQTEEAGLEAILRQKVRELQERYCLQFSDPKLKLITRRSAECQIDVETAVEEIKAVHEAVEDYAGKFSLRNDLDISFTEEARDRLVEKVWENGVDAVDYLNQAFQNYEHGLKLIREKTGQRSFSITAEGMEYPERYLNRLIQETYR